MPCLPERKACRRREESNKFTVADLAGSGGENMTFSKVCRNCGNQILINPHTREFCCDLCKEKHESEKLETENREQKTAEIKKENLSKEVRLIKMLAPDKLSYSQKLHKLRLDRGFTQRDLAVKAGITSLTMKDFEEGNRKPSDDCLKRLAEAFEMSIKDLKDYLK